MARIFALFVIIIVTPPALAQKKVCFTIDDMPLVTYGVTDTTCQRSMMNNLIAGLTTHRIPAIGFVNEVKLYNNNQLVKFQVQLLESWLAAGLQLGNHSFAHLDYNNLSPADFFSQITRGEVVTKKMLASRNMQLAYFRHPFLHTGATKAKSDSLNQFLADHHYTVAPVTIDNADYLFAAAYKRAQDKHDTQLMQKIGNDFVDYIEQKVLYYERQSEALFGRQIHQVLLLHANALNADYLPALAALFQNHNYTFISLDEALQDKAYETPVTVYGKWGISWIDRWALSQGKKGDFFKGDPDTPAYISN